METHAAAGSKARAFSLKDWVYEHRWRLALIAATVLLMGLLAGGFRILEALGITSYGAWFLDLQAILATLDAQRLGWDVYAPNPLDCFHRPHVYSSWWLELGLLGLTQADTVWLGLTLDAVFLVVALVWLRPKSWGAMLGCAAIFFSPPVLLAIQRANNDLVVFLVLAWVPMLLTHASRILRLAGYFFILFAVGLKYYPVVLSVFLFLGGDRRELRSRLVIFGLLLLLIGVSLWDDLLRLRQLMPVAKGLISFGATAVPSLLGSTWGGWSLLAKAVGGLAFGLVYWRAKGAKGAEPDEDELRFLMGSLLLVACFWSGMNFGYRWIFALWLVPWLLKRAVNAEIASEARNFARLVIVLLVVNLWGDTLIITGVNRFIGLYPQETLQCWADVLYIVEQPFAWAFFISLLAYVAEFSKGRLVAFRISAQN